MIVLEFWQLFLVLWLSSFVASFAALEIKDWLRRR